jgi:hypothetical protein
LNLREDPGSLPFALILVAAVAGKDSSKCGRGTTLGIIIYHTIQSPTQFTKITLLSAWLRLRFHVCPTQLPTRFDRMPSITDNACNTFTSRRDGTELPSKVRAVQHRALHACSTPRSLGGDSRKHSRSSAATGSISSQATRIKSSTCCTSIRCSMALATRTRGCARAMHRKCTAGEDSRTLRCCVHCTGTATAVSDLSP